jgi:hypothetical protein
MSQFENCLPKKNGVIPAKAGNHHPLFDYIARSGAGFRLSPE